jgi:integrase
LINIFHPDEGRGRDLNPGARLHRRGGNGDSGDLLADFCDFGRVDLRLADRTVKGYRRTLRRFLKDVNKPAGQMTAEDIRAWLRPFADGSANTYGNALKPLKLFFRDFMKMADAVESFKFKKAPLTPITVPSKDQLRKFYGALRIPVHRALFLMYASSGLRKMELLTLTKDDVDWEKRMIIPKVHSGESKRSWVAFFNAEADQALREYLVTRKDDDSKLFKASPRRLIDVWKCASEESGVRITPQALREWFCDEMGRRGVPDRYVDAFCGRVPGSMLAKRYSDFAPEKLKEVYEKAGIKVLS